MPSLFEGKKAKILQQLSVPDSTYQDASPKGSVDEGIRGLVDEINVLDTLVTTSSCAGRIAVYLEGKRKGKTITEIDSTEVANAGAGGKGGGQWLFVSHDPLSEGQQNQELTSMFGMSAQGGISMPASTQDVRWVRCKFEPMVGNLLSLIFLVPKVFSCPAVDIVYRFYTSFVLQLKVLYVFKLLHLGLDLERVASPVYLPSQTAQQW